MGDVIDLFATVRASNRPAPSLDSIDVGPLAWLPLHEIRAQALPVESASGRTLIAKVCRLVARDLVFSRYAAPGDTGMFRAIDTDTALRRAVDLLDLAEELSGQVLPPDAGAGA